MWPRRHGNITPLAAPALHGIDLYGAVDGVEEGDGNDRGGQGHNSRYENSDGGNGYLVSELFDKVSS